MLSASENYHLQANKQGSKHSPLRSPSPVKASSALSHHRRHHSFSLSQAQLYRLELNYSLLVFLAVLVKLLSAHSVSASSWSTVPSRSM